MSEQSEHTSEGTDTEPIAANRSNEQSESETSMLNNQTEPAMLEDEEMPTFVSVSSTSRREDSTINNTKQEEIPVEEDNCRSPYPSYNQGAESVYLVSSGEESDHPLYHDDEYGDSDDTDDVVHQNEHGNTVIEDEEEEEDEDEDDEDDRNPLRMHNDDDDDEMDGEYEPECSDRASDDFILSNRLQKHHKERSLSLQDLSICKNNVRTPYNKKRHSINILRQNYLSSQQNTVMYNVTHRKQSMPLRYRHVESKVKRYIKDIKEQSRRSMERRIKGQEFMITNNHMDGKNNDIEQRKPAITSKTIKDYAEKAIKDLQLDECDEDVNSICNMAQILENGKNKLGSNAPGNQNKCIPMDHEMEAHYETIRNEKNAQNCEDKIEKRNGSVDINSHRLEQVPINKNTKFSDINDACVVNGHQQTPTVFHLRTLSYEEYMHGVPTPNEKENSARHINMTQKPSENEESANAEIIDVPESENAIYPIKVQNVTSVRLTSAETESFTKENQTERSQTETLEISHLKLQLNQKTMQFNTLKGAYDKTLAENLRMKQELDALKKSLSKYESENKACETKVAAVQTEKIAQLAPNQERVTDVKETTNKISTSSVASTISSIDQWTDSACSPAISIKPPDLTTVLNSDDSIVLTDGTPRKAARPLSRAFITSSRILQTLSNITQGKTKPESPLVRNTKKRLNENPMDQLLNLNCNSPIQASSSKKRKATDMLGASTFLQPFKIPHTTLESQRKNPTPTTSAEFKYTEDLSKSKLDQTQNSTATANVSRSGSPTCTETKPEESDDHEDNVKCFVYREDENSKDQSFLIQAEEPMKDALSNEKGRIRECGPYLLGNVEVRMSEVNGTISIWGKEVSQESTTETEDEVEKTERKTCPCWQKTPQTRFNGSPIVCSTNKKPKAQPRYGGSSASHWSHSTSTNAMKIPFMLDGVEDKGHVDSPFSTRRGTHACENCDSSKYHKEWPSCKRISNSQENIHSCCTHPVEFKERECSCALYQERQQYNNSPNRSKDKYSLKGNRRSSSRNTPDSRHMNESCTNHATEHNEYACKYNTSCRCSLQNTIDTCQQSAACCNATKNMPHVYRSTSSNVSNHESADRHSCNHSPSRDGDEDPLLPFKRPNETPETRQRRLSGKRVRGILMDLLKGCGDCRSSSIAGDNKGSAQEKKTPYLPNHPPQIKISPAREPACSSFVQSGNRCCHAYARRIESQLEEFRIEMERVRSRSDAILDMLSMLHSVDMN